MKRSALKAGFLFLLAFSYTPCIHAQVKDFGSRDPIAAPDDPETRWLSAELYKNGFMFSPGVKEAYINYCLGLVAPQLQFSGSTWEWLMAHPGVLSAAFSVEYPPNPNILYNYVKLALATGPQRAERFEQLLLANAIACRNRRIETNRMSDYDHPGLSAGVGAEEGWFLNKYKEPEKLSASDEADGGSDALLRVKRQKELAAQYHMSDSQHHDLAKWFKANPRVKIYTLMPMTLDQIYTTTGIRLTRQPNNGEWMKIAYNAHRIPPRQPGGIHENLMLHIERFEEGQRMNRNLFPLDKAPWPLLLGLTDQDPLDESEYAWLLYKKTGSVPGYATYTFSYEKIENRYKDSAWHPDSYFRIIEDGGVCGRLSTMAEFGQRSIGTPAWGMGQPGHRAFMTYECNNGSYHAAMHHSVDTIEVSTVGWRLPPPIGLSFDSKGLTNTFSRLHGSVNVRYHFGLCEAMNRGLSGYENSRMALDLLEIYPKASHEQKIALMRSGMIENVANTDVVFTLAKLYTGKPNNIQRLITAFRNAVVKVDAGTTEGQKIKADQDLTRMLKDPHVNVRNAKKVTNEWGLFVSNSLFMGAFATMPDVNAPQFDSLGAGEKIMLVRHYADAVKDELAYQKKIEGNAKYTALVQEIFDKYEKTKPANLQKQSVKSVSTKIEKQKEAGNW